MMVEMQSRNWRLTDNLDWFASEDRRSLLMLSEHAIERECLRVDPSGHLAQTRHHAAIGHPLTHPQISTDFAESQLELITPRMTSERDAVGVLHGIHRYLYERIGDELLWPLSVPSQLPDNADDIPLAQYGDSPKAQSKTLYRKGLGYRYGRRMQTLSGVHYNFSFGPEFWSQLHARSGVEGSLQAFINDRYLHTIRNYLRCSWINTWLFGCTPAVDSSFLEKPHASLQPLGERSLIAPYGTSLRLSEIGYTSDVQAKLHISYDTLGEYLRDVTHAITEAYPAYSEIGTDPDGAPRQMNDHYLQCEAELYSVIRPKPPASVAASQAQGLKDKGIAYLEVRGIDIDHTVPDGVDDKQLRFVHMLLVYCLLSESPKMDHAERIACLENHNAVAMRGREPGLTLVDSGADKSLSDWAGSIVADLQPVAAMLDSASGTDSYSSVLEQQARKVADVSKTPSAQVVEALQVRGIDLCELGLEIAGRHKAQFVKEPVDADAFDKLDLLAKESLKNASQL